MKLVASIRTFASALFHRARVEREIDEELRAHIENRAADLEHSGLPRAEAERRARIEFGGYEAAKEECRDALGISFLESLLGDIRFGLRMLRKNPGFAAVAIVTLALGIGANTAVFSLAEAALFPEFPVSDPGRLAGIYTSGPKGAGYSSTSYPDYVYYRSHDQAFSGLMAYVHIRLAWRHGDQTTYPWAAIATSNYFTVLGLRPFMGRAFQSDEGVGKGPAVAVVSYAFWRQQLASDPKVLGRSLILNSHPFTIIGVLPQNFRGVDLAWGEIPQIWIPMSMLPVAMPVGGNRNLLEMREARILLMMGRLKRGVSLEQAQARSQWSPASLRRHIRQPTRAEPRSC
jgi:hypothetical protein